MKDNLNKWRVILWKKKHLLCARWIAQVAQVVKNPTASAGDIRDMGSISGSGRSPGGSHGNPL